MFDTQYFLLIEERVHSEKKTLTKWRLQYKNYTLFKTKNVAKIDTQNR